MVAPAIIAAIPTVLEIGGKLIDKIFPDPGVAAEHKLRLMELAQQGELAELANAVERLRVEAEDRSSARNREIQTGDLGTPRNLAYMLTAGFFSVLFSVMVFGVDESARDTVNLLLGSLGTVWLGAMAYYHGSSSGSAWKSRLLADEAERRR